MIDSGPLNASTIVYPSGAAFAVSPTATVPPAAGLFSTTTGWPRRSLSLSAIVRPRTSMELPAGADITNLIGLSGQVCAGAFDVAARADRADRTSSKIRADMEDAPGTVTTRMSAAGRRPKVRRARR